jgi:hypothetical protein
VRDAWDAGPYLASIPEAEVCPVGGSGGAEVFFQSFVDDALVFTSAPSGCPARWGNETFKLTHPYATVRIDFTELDAFFHDFVASVCRDTFGDGTRPGTGDHLARR